MVALAVDPLFRGRGVGNALVESLVDRIVLPNKRKKLSERLKKNVPDQLWLITEVPGYFLPTGFILADVAELPESLRSHMNDLCAAMKLPKGA
jgi:N-acetylglutamate synthase-like GNAT family acetyltransferase